MKSNKQKWAEAISAYRREKRHLREGLYTFPDSKRKAKQGKREPRIEAYARLYGIRSNI